MSIHNYKNIIIIDTKKMTIEWKKGDRIVNPHMIKDFKAIWREGGGIKDDPFPFKSFKALWRKKESEKDIPFPFIVDNFELKLNTADYQVK